jgi:tetratricopeptide (TPR) repeat protein
VALNQSPFLNVLSDRKVVDTLKLMTRPVNTKLTPEVAQELCQRTGSKAYIAGSIASLGSEYALGFKAVNCQNGDTLAQEQVTASTKEKVLDGMGDAAAKLRAKLGESLASVQKYDVPLSEATTSSLEALQSYSLAIKVSREQGRYAALPYDQRAIQFDPNFAMGYLAVGKDYRLLGQLQRANEYYTKAFELREHASEWEKLNITAGYYQSVTGELDKAAEACQLMIDNFPRQPGGYYGSGSILGAQGKYENGLERWRQAQKLVPALYTANFNYLLAVQRFDEAQRAVEEPTARKLDTIVLHNVLYALACSRHRKTIFHREHSRRSAIHSSTAQNCPICGLLLQHLSLSQPVYRRILLLTGLRATSPVGIGNSVIRPSIAPNRRLVRWLSASKSQ